MIFIFDGKTKANISSRLLEMYFCNLLVSFLYIYYSILFFRLERV